MLKILIIHGPNLNLLGEREPDVYGRTTLEGLNQQIQSLCEELSVQVRFFQSNHEGNLIDYIHKHRKWADGIVINPGAFTHYSYALRDAISGVALPAVEVHLSDIQNREEFRKISVIKPVCIHQFSGDGIESYLNGVRYLVQHLKSMS
ncbi:MAG: type II 3-dehydroquinate dehydratase [Calditrichaeota bacterium]|nr:type II 3-dehydroquinate dehydratase [Calditrichota bacterium]